MRALRQLDEMNMYKNIADLQDKKHENTVLSGEREAAASVVRTAIVVTDHKRGDGVGGELANFHHLWSAGEEVLNPVTE